MSFIAGRYVATWNSLAIGQCDNEQGIRISTQYFAEEVKGDAYGDTVQDLISQGGDCFVDLTLIEADSAAVATIRNPMGTAYQVPMAGVPLVAAGKAKALVLTAQTGTSAAGGTGTGGPNGGSPATITILSCLHAASVAIVDTLNTKNRKLALRLRAFPSLVSQVPYWASVT